VQDRGCVALARRAPRGGVRHLLPDAPHARDGVELADGAGAGPAAPPARARDGRGPARGCRRARGAHAAAPVGASPGAPGKAAGGAPWPPARQAIGPRARAAGRAARADGRADRAVLPPRSPALLRGARFRVSGPLHLHGRILADLPQRRRERGLPDGLPRRWAVVLDPQRAVRGAVRGGDEGRLALSAVPAPGTRPRARRLYRDRGPPAGRRMDRRRIGARVAGRAPRGSPARLKRLSSATSPPRPPASRRCNSTAVRRRWRTP